ncbi:PEGA domain-containing protein [Methanovulcanius yangii]|uniref:PEGA domain-containing protein n=1 Tax=Methanovulcanius yangii TaxID=1789227 RepID=UPI0029CA1CF2|nr:PEGA domain-containing protein [Methanovulcanius yangii]
MNYSIPAAAMALLLLCAAVPSAMCAGTIGGDEGWYDIHTNVDGAAIYFDGEYKGETTGGILSVAVYSTATPYSTVTASKNGYSSASANLPTMPGAGEHQSVYLTLNPIQPTTGAIRISSSPSGADVYIDGVYKGTTTETVSGLSAGSHDLRLKYPGYNDYYDTITITAGQTVTTQAVLKAQATYGTISVTTTPSNAQVYIDGDYKGTSPRTVGGLSQGAHILEITMPGYEEWSNQFNIHSNQVTYVTATLKAIPNPTTGTVSITSNPAYASVYLDGVYHGQTEPGTPLVINGVTAGTHTVKVTLAGYQDSVTSVTVNSGQTSTVTANLQGGATGNGAIDVTSSPTGATVYLNNVNKGITPVTLTDLTPGSYTVTLKLSGYTDYSSTVEVNSGATSYVSASLSPTSTPTQSPVPVFGLLAGLGIAGLLAASRRRD